MARVKRAVNAQKKRRTILKASKGYRGQRSRLYRKAKEQQLHSLTYAYRDRKARKGDFRKLWITRINAAARANGITYNRLIQGLKPPGGSRSTARTWPSSPSAMRPRSPRWSRSPRPLCPRMSTHPPERLPDAHRALQPSGCRDQAAPPFRTHPRRTFFSRRGGLTSSGAALRRGVVSEVFATESAAARFADLLVGAEVQLVTERAAKKHCRTR